MGHDWGFRNLHCVDLKTAGDKTGDPLLFFIFLLVLSSDLKIQKGFQVPGKSGFREGADAAKPMGRFITVI